MSWNPTDRADDPVRARIIPRARDLGGFEVRRALPAPNLQMVGPFIFFDQVGPVEFITGQGIDVRPHPHIGLATVTYLFQGEFEHRDSLGNHQMIYPGEVNWMIAGEGVTHSERTSAETRRGPHDLFGIQTWVALPEADEDRPPAFEHHGREAQPVISDGGAEVRLILGRGWGAEHPVRTFSDMFYADVRLAPGARLPLPDDHEDRGIYLLDGEVEIAGIRHKAGEMLVFRPGDPIVVEAGGQGARWMALGGDTMAGPRYIWWNFVSSSREKIEEAGRAWQAGDFRHGRFHLPSGDDHEHVPIPDALWGTLPRG